MENEQEQVTQPNYDYKDYSENIDVGDMHADIRYILVLPFDSDESFKYQNYGTIPDIVTYKDELTKVSSLIQKYKNINSSFQGKTISFTYRAGRTLNSSHTMKDIAKQLKRSNINGLCVCVKVNKDNDSDDEVLYIDEGNLSSYLSNQYESGSMNKFELMIQIPTQKGTQNMGIKIDNNCTGDHIHQKVLKQLNLEYGITLGKQDVKEIVIKQSKKKLMLDQHIVKQKIYDKSVLVLILENPTIKLKKTSTKQYNSYLKIFKEGESEPQTFKYSDVSDLTFQQLYRSKLELHESKKKKDAIYSLKIMDLIIQPNEPLSKAQQLFKNYDNTPLNLIGKVVNEKMIFFYHIPKLANHEMVFKLQNLKMPQSQVEKRKKYRDLSRSRAQKTLNDYFKNQQNIEPILIYTSELKYQQSPGRVVKIYESLNRFLRENSLLTLQTSTIGEEWRYRYASTLLKHLQKIEKYKGLVYRGISYDPLLQKGNITTFRQFVSTSVSREAAISFAKKYKSMKVKHLFEMEISSGYPIKQYSEFTNEEEVLLEPFSEFQVRIIKEEDIDGHHFRIYHLKQLMTSKKLPNIQTNFVIWIDTNTKQARKIYDSIQYNQTTHLTQLLSTEELKDWLSRHVQLLNDPTAKVIFLTNMSRKENGEWNGIAGIQGLRQIRKVDSKVPVYFYIGNVEKAIQKMNQNHVDMNGIIIGDSIKGVRQYLISEINGK